MYLNFYTWVSLGVYKLPHEMFSLLQKKPNKGELKKKKVAHLLGKGAQKKKMA